MYENICRCIQKTYVAHGTAFPYCLVGEVPVIFDIFVSHINSLFIRLLKNLEIQYSKTRIETKEIIKFGILTCLSLAVGNKNNLSLVKWAARVCVWLFVYVSAWVGVGVLVRHTSQKWFSGTIISLHLQSVSKIFYE